MLMLMLMLKTALYELVSVLSAPLGGVLRNVLAIHLTAT